MLFSKIDKAEPVPGPKQPRALPAWKGGLEVRHPQHGTSATIDPRDIELAQAAGWVLAE
jgi:hypothetical protein